jgi:murein DD-endopeptidase MepM/ murein hydrolase activator NlpD
MKFAFRPLKVWVINQKFGENNVCVDNATSSHVIGCDGKNPPEGYRSVYGPNGHLGLDLGAPRWTPFYFCYDGKVIEKQVNVQRGLGVGVLHNPEPGVYFLSRYWHLIGMDVDMGEEVKLGDFGGYCDNTGYSSGDHLHFEIGTCDSVGGNYVPIDPLTVLYPTFALDAKGIIAKIREQIAAISDKIADLLRGR